MNDFLILITTIASAIFVAFIVSIIIEKFGFKEKQLVEYDVRRKRVWKKSDGSVVYAPKGSIFIVVSCNHNGSKYTSFRHIPGNSPKEFEQFMAEQEFQELREKFNF